VGLRGGSAGETGAGDTGAAAVTPGMESACVVGGRGSLSLPAMRDAMLGTSSEKYSICEFYLVNILGQLLLRISGRLPPGLAAWSPRPGAAGGSHVARSGNVAGRGF
jgi:hypothetical protein